ncbi:MAG: sigma 54-interacting transcriptional regulator [Eubacterium sp.]|nr:sigma 54-interacting transcriptional regulator [Candidatus Colimonas fimequi]
MNKLRYSIQLNTLIPVLEGISDASFIDDADGICIWCNSACEEFYLIDKDDILGKTVNELEGLGIFSQSVTKIVLENKLETTIIHENKAGRKLLTSGYPIFDDDGNIIYIITTSRDITSLTSRDKRLAAINNKMLDVTQIDNMEVPESNAIASSVSMQNVMTLTKRLANVASPVLITGESGVGKGLIAKTLHEEGVRADGPFIVVNCSAIPETMIEAEFFGYVRGTFTGSRAEGKIGLFESAEGGTIFLDDVSELSLNMQAKLLRVLRDRVITRVGSIKNIPIDVRIISATNKNLRDLVKAGKIRDDLYYSPNVAPIAVPPLRERPEDILPLIQVALKKFNEELNENKILSSDALTVLLKYQWPGNVRELENIIERLIITTDARIITSSQIPSFLREDAETNTNVNTDTSLQLAMEKAEREILTNALQTYKSTRAMAKVLQVSQPTIVRKLNKYGLTLSKSE